MNYYCWITVMLRSAETPLVVEMVKKGYKVSSLDLSSRITLGAEDHAGQVVSLLLSSYEENNSPQTITNDFIAICKKNKILYYSIIVVESAKCYWAASNIKLPEHASDPMKPALKKNEY